MKQSLKTLVVVLSLCFLTPNMASATTYPDRMGTKLGNGMANIITGIVEIPKAVINGNRKNGAAYAATAGFMTGMVHMMGRTLCGAADVVTFMIPTKPIINPDFVWQNFKQDTGYKGTWELLP
jgi:putative exosortase-associated protein (TIGR04073 family)